MTVDNGKWIQLSNGSSVCTWRLKQMSLRRLKELRCAQYIAVYSTTQYTVHRSIRFDSFKRSTIDAQLEEALPLQIFG